MRVLPASTVLVCVLAVAAATQPVRIGDVLPASLSTPHPYPPGDPDRGPVWSGPIYHPGGSLIKVHLANFDLAPGDYVVARDAEGHEVDRVTAREGNARGEIWALSVPGELCVIELYATRQGGRRYGFDIEKFAWIWNLDALPGVDTTCLTNDKEQIRCYKDSNTKPASVYQHARALCGMARVNSTATFCSGGLASRDGLFYTANHCVGSQSSANSLEVWFDYERQSCAGGPLVPTIRVRGPQSLVGTFSCNDASLLRLNPSAVSATGLDVPGTHDYIPDRPTPLIQNERCWIAGHPGGRPKEASYTGNPIPQVTVLAKVIRCSPARNFFGHTADTEGGSSGSTVLDLQNRRIGVHGYGGCRTSQPVGSNGASRMDLIWPQVKNEFGAWNTTIRMVPDGDDTTTPVGNGTPIPFGVAEARTQTLITAADLGRKGPIEDLALASTSRTTITIARLQVRMAHRAATTLSANFDTNLAKNATVVYDGPLTWKTVNDGWLKLGLRTPFDYNGKDSLVIEYRVRGLSGGTLFHSAWRGGAAARPLRNYASGAGSFTATTATTNNEPAGMKHRLYFAYRPRVVTAPDQDAASASGASPLFKSSEARYQWFMPRDMMASHGKLIGLAWAASETGVHSATALQIRVSSTSSLFTFTSSFNNNIAGATTVFNGTPGQLRLVKGQWHGLQFTTPFNYSGQTPLVVEVRYLGGAGGANCYRNTDTTNGIRRAVRFGSGAYNSPTAASLDSNAAKIKFLYANASVVKAGVARVGQTQNLTWSATDFGGRSYVAAAAFDTSPGMALGGDDRRLVPLNLDPLFAASRLNPATFVGFTGTLNSSGTATGGVVIPNVGGLVGVAYYLGFVVVDPSPAVPSAIADIAEPSRSVIQP